MRGTITIKILEGIAEGIAITGDIIAAILESGYGASYGKLERNLRKQETRRHSREIQYSERQRVYSLLSKLRREGFIKQKNRKWKLTQNGEKKLNKLKRLFSKDYPKEAAGQVTIVVFDIPEKEKYKREWLRAVLVRLGFTMLQKSVWIGKVKIPEELIRDLHRLKILSCIEILAVDKSGTLKYVNTT